MMLFRKAIPRRTFLRGAGTALALPLLDSMIPAFAEPKPALRMPPPYAHKELTAAWIAMLRPEARIG